MALDHIRSRNEKTKRRYLVALSCVAMILVISLWVRYFTEVVLQPAHNELRIAEAPERSNPTIWDTLVGGAAAAYRGIAGTISETFHILKTPQNYDVKPQE